MKGIFDNVPEENYFYLANGLIVKNLGELLSALDMIDNETFEKHVNKEKNDFADWVRDIYKAQKFSESLRKSNKIESMIKVIRKYFNDIEKDDISFDLFGIKLNKLLVGFILGSLFGISLGMLLFTHFLN